MFKDIHQHLQGSARKQNYRYIIDKNVIDIYIIKRSVYSNFAYYRNFMVVYTTHAMSRQALTKQNTYRYGVPRFK